MNENIKWRKEMLINLLKFEKKPIVNLIVDNLEETINSKHKFARGG
jgi:hypothetical protein